MPAFLMDEIIPGLFLGSWDAAYDRPMLEVYKISHILSAVKMPRPRKTRPGDTVTVYSNSVWSSEGLVGFAPPEGVTWKEMHILDSPTEDLLRFLPEAVEFLKTALDQGGAVLVHCQAGISRSPAIVIAYLIESRKLSVESALEFVTARRKCVQPNAGFMTQLAVWHAARCLASSDDKATRLFYAERTYRQVSSAGGPKDKAGRVEVRQDMLARVTALSGIGQGNRIRCKMCRHPLAAREHMFPHGAMANAFPGTDTVVATRTTTVVVVAGAEAPTADVTSTTVALAQLSVSESTSTPSSSSAASSPVVENVTTEPSVVATAVSTPHAQHAPIIDPGCSGYFVEPLAWMSETLASGVIAGKLECPNTRCRAKLGSFDWAGAKCACGEWVTPSFCIHRSRVDEMK